MDYDQFANKEVAIKQITEYLKKRFGDDSLKVNDLARGSLIISGVGKRSRILNGLSQLEANEQGKLQFGMKTDGTLEKISISKCFTDSHPSVNSRVWWAVGEPCITYNVFPSNNDTKELNNNECAITPFIAYDWNWIPCELTDEELEIWTHLEKEHEKRALSSSPPLDPDDPYFIR